MVVRVHPWLVSYMATFLAPVGVLRRVDAFIDCDRDTFAPTGLCVALLTLDEVLLPLAACCA